MSESEPTDEVSRAFLDAVKTKTQTVSWDKSEGNLLTALMTAGIKVA